MLKLDATAEMDEFSKYLNEFEDEVLVDKKKEVCTLYKNRKIIIRKLSVRTLIVIVYEVLPPFE